MTNPAVGYKGSRELDMLAPHKCSGKYKEMKLAARQLDNLFFMYLLICIYTLSIYQGSVLC